jgi:hypothetical protein
MLIFIRAQLAGFWKTFAVIRNNKSSGMNETDVQEQMETFQHA